MLGVLTKTQSEQILRSEVFGRIGCYADGRVYVVPVTYAFDGAYIYAHSKEGLKIQMMRKNPKVCFQVDRMENMANWRSVIVWGKYEELNTKRSQENAMKIVKDRLTPLVLSESVVPSHSVPDPRRVVKELKAVAYRISVIEVTGRYEKNG
jgi:nitroimidazol reductase NimA-like FMN-containing flavoprotein (pyridoxamine 5'-phosphate oxidase superfamily)